MSDKNVVHAHVQRDFRQALECEPEGTLLVLNERGGLRHPRRAPGHAVPGGCRSRRGGPHRRTPPPAHHRLRWRRDLRGGRRIREGGHRRARQRC